MCSETNLINELLPGTKASGDNKVEPTLILSSGNAQGAASIGDTYHRGKAAVLRGQIQKMFAKCFHRLILVHYKLASVTEGSLVLYWPTPFRISLSALSALGHSVLIIFAFILSAYWK